MGHPEFLADLVHKRGNLGDEFGFGDFGGRLLGVPHDLVARWVDRTGGDGLAPGRAEFHDHAVLRELPLAGGRAGHGVDVVGAWFLIASENRPGMGQKLGRVLDGEWVVEVDVHHAPRRLAEEDADVGVRGEVGLEVVAGEAEILPLGEAWAFLAWGDGDDREAAGDEYGRGFKRGHMCGTRAFLRSCARGDGLGLGRRLPDNNRRRRPIKVRRDFREP